MPEEEALPPFHGSATQRSKCAKGGEGKWSGLLPFFFFFLISSRRKVDHRGSHLSVQAKSHLAEETLFLLKFAVLLRTMKSLHKEENMRKKSAAKKELKMGNVRVIMPTSATPGWDTRVLPPAVPRGSPTPRSAPAPGALPTAPGSTPRVCPCPPALAPRAHGRQRGAGGAFVQWGVCRNLEVSGTWNPWGARGARRHALPRGEGRGCSGVAQPRQAAPSHPCVSSSAGCGLLWGI